MANNYTQFSVSLTLPNKEAVDYALDLKQRMDIAHQDGCEEPDDIPREWWPLIDGWGGFEAEKLHPNDLWIHDGGESGDPESAAALVQHLLEKYLPNECFYISWAATCSKPRLDEFGGGALFITAQGVTGMSSWDWARKQQDKWEKTKNANKSDTGSAATV